MENLSVYNKLARPPKEALKTIQAGRLKGKSDINPQWRIKAMTEQFGPVGIGWKMAIKRTWSEPGADNEVFAFAEVDIYTKDGDKWSEPIPGVGGHKLVISEKNGMHNNDEGYKMAITDALSTSMKLLGMAADVYAGAWDGSKYRDEPKTNGQSNGEVKQLVPNSDNWFKTLEWLKKPGNTVEGLKKHYKFTAETEQMLNEIQTA